MRGESAAPARTRRPAARRTGHAFALRVDAEPLERRSARGRACFFGSPPRLRPELHGLSFFGAYAGAARTRPPLPELLFRRQLPDAAPERDLPHALEGGRARTLVAAHVRARAARRRARSPLRHHDL